VRLNRAIAIAELDGPEVALAEIERLPLKGYHAFHAAQAHLLRELGRNEEAREAYQRSIDLAGNAAETAYLIRRRDELAGQ
jgi:RNA polymerase sigma-70 factor (ECF subfamily)